MSWRKKPKTMGSVKKGDTIRVDGKKAKVINVRKEGSEVNVHSLGLGHGGQTNFKKSKPAKKRSWWK